MIRRLLAAAVLTTAALGAGADTPAGAHPFDNNAAFVCAYAREWPYENHALIHAHAGTMGPGWAKYNCEGTDLVTVCQWTAVQSIFGITGESLGCGDV